MQNMPRAKALYEGVFAVRLLNLRSPETEMWAFPMQEQGTGASGALVKMNDCASGGNSTLF